MERFGSHMETFGGQIGSEQSMIPFQSFGPFSIFGMMREWYQGNEDDLHECITTITEEWTRMTCMSETLVLQSSFKLKEAK